MNIIITHNYYASLLNVFTIINHWIKCIRIYIGRFTKHDYYLFSIIIAVIQNLSFFEFLIIPKFIFSNFSNFYTIYAIFCENPNFYFFE